MTGGMLIGGQAEPQNGVCSEIRFPDAAHPKLHQRVDRRN
jgi:hypothetical protein